MLGSRVSSQGSSWRGDDLLAAGVYLPSNPYSSFFYMMTGAHARARRRGAGASSAGGLVATRSARKGPSGPHRWDATMGALPDLLALPGSGLGTSALFARCIDHDSWRRASTVDRWDGGICPFEAGWRKVLMWAFIVTDGLLFAGFLCVVRIRAGLVVALAGPGRRSSACPYIAAMTFVLISSSATMAIAVQAAREGRSQAALRFVAADRVVGGARVSRHAGVRMAARHRRGRAARRRIPGATRVRRLFLPADRFPRHARPDRAHRPGDDGGPLGERKSTPDGVEMAGLYWHFVDLVWVFIFTLFYLL